jgi:hypothetical protein
MSTGGYVWVKNNTHASVKFKIVEPTDDGSKQEKIILFARERTDKFTGMVQANGYTKILEADYDLLYEQQKVFKEFIDQKNFVMFEDPPADAYTDAQRIIQLEADKGELQLQVQQLGTQVSSLQGQLQAAQGAQASLAQLQADFDAYKAANPPASAEPSSGGN